MSEYSYQDVMRMQSEAKQRVLEMQKRSRYAAERFNGQKGEATEEKHPDEETELPRIPKAISYPTELPSARKRQGTRQVNTGGINIRKAIFDMFGNLSADDYEKMFLLALCVLLSQEQCDDSLILALMYLMT